MNMLDGKSILITGGTGSFGKAFTLRLLKDYNPKRLIIYSRDEYKQYVMRESLKDFDAVLRFFIGDVRDSERLYRAFDGVDIVIHAAALKQVPAAEYNPFEAIKTNIHGAQNVIDAAIDRSVSKVVALSTDKAVNPINLYGATKLASDKLFIAANAYVGKRLTSFSVVRYGNVAGSRGSVVPYFEMIISKGSKELPITDFRMTRFWITMEEAIDLVLIALNTNKGGEIYVSKIPSFRIVDLAKAMDPNVNLKEIGIREGEKLHEVMITEYDSLTTYEYTDHYIIYPNLDWWDTKSHFTEGGTQVEQFFRYASDQNTQWLDVDAIRERLRLLNTIY
jgi:UDP-N-acetylglucosamine 4,6-dehydratase